MNKKNLKKILWISFFQAQGLDNTSLFNTLSQLSNFGHEVTLITVLSPRTNIFQNRLFKAIIIPFKRMPLLLSFLFTIILWFYLPIIIINSRIDTVVIEPGVQIISTIPSLFVSKIKKVNFILDVRSTPVETQFFSGKLLKYWFKVSVLIAKHTFDAITVITSSMAKKLFDDFRITDKKMGIWTSGVSLDLFDPSMFQENALQLRAKLNLLDCFVVFYHGAFTKSRGLLETINAVNLLKKRYPKIVLLLLGDGPFRSILEKAVNNYQLKDNVIITGPVDQIQVPNYICMSNLAIVPLPNNSYWRFQSPLKLLEYLAMEKTVVLTRIPAHIDIVHDSECGIYLSSVDPKEIAREIELAYLDRENLNDRGRVGRRLVEERYSWKRVVGDLEKLIVSFD